MRGWSWLTLFCPLGVDTYAGDAHGAHVSVLFAGSVVVYGLLAAVCRPSRLAVLCLVAAAFVYAASLSSEYAVGRFLTLALPFFRHIRLHSWLAPMVQFFIVSAAAAGTARAQRTPLTWAERVSILAIGVVASLGTAEWLAWQPDMPFGDVRVAVSVCACCMLLFTRCSSGMVKHTRRVTACVRMDARADRPRRKVCLPYAYRANGS